MADPAGGPGAVPDDDPNLDALERATEQDPQNPDAFFQLALELERRGFPERAVSAYRRAINLAPDASGPHGSLGRILVRLGRLDEAEQSLRRAIALDPQNLAAHGNLGAALSQQWRVYEAQDEIREVLALDPSDEFAPGALEVLISQQTAMAADTERTLNVAGRLSREGHSVEAEKMVRAALLNASADARLWVLLGIALMRQDGNSEARPPFERAIALDPCNGVAEMNLGLILARQQLYEEAHAHLGRAVELRPADPKAYFNLGRILSKLGRAGEAEPVLRRALELDSGRVLMARSRAEAYLTLAEVRADRFWESRNVADARAAIEALTAVQLPVLEPATCIEALCRAGQIEDALWTYGLDPSARERAVSWYQRATDLDVNRDSLPPDVRGQLGAALRVIYLTRRRREDLDLAVAELEAAVAALPADERSAMARSNLSGALDDVYRLDQNVATLLRAIDLARSAVDMTRHGDPARTLRTGNLLGVLMVQYTLDGNVQHLDEAIRLGRETLADAAYVTPKNLSDFAGALKRRYLRVGRSTDLTEAVSALEAAFERTGPEDSRSRRVVAHNLVGALIALGGQGQDRALVERALQLARQTVEETPTDDPWRANRLGQYADALIALEVWRSGEALLEEAIRTLRDAIKVAAALPTNMRGTLFFRLSNAYRRRWERNACAVDLDAAIEVQATGISELSDGAPERPTHLNDLATLRLERFTASGDASYLFAAIDAWEAAWRYLGTEFAMLPIAFKLGSLRAYESVPDQLIRAHLQAAELDQSEAHTRRAWEVAEAAKARLLSELITYGHVPPPPDIPRRLVGTEQQLLEGLTQLTAAALAREISGVEGLDGPAQDVTTELARVQTDLGRVWDEIEEHSPSGREYISLRRPRSVTWADVENLLCHTQVPTALLTVRISGQSTVLMAALSGLPSPRVVSSKYSADDWNSALRRLGEELALSGGDDSSPETWHLDIAAILEPLVDDLLSVSHIVVLPTGHATLIPWPVLWQRILAKRGLDRTIDVSIGPAASFLLRTAVDHREPSGRALAPIIQ